MLRNILIIALVLSQSLNAEAAGRKGKKKPAKKDAAVTQPVGEGTAAPAAAGASGTPAAAAAPAAEPTPAPAAAPAPAPAPAAEVASSSTSASAGDGATAASDGAPATTNASSSSTHEVRAAPASSTGGSAAAPSVAESGDGTAAQPAGLGLGVAAKLGGTFPTSKLGLTYMAGLEVGYTLPFLDGLLGVAAELDYLSPAYGQTAMSEKAGGDYDYDLDQRVLMLAAEATARLPLGDLTPYGGVGYGVYFLRAKMSAFDETNTESQTRSGLQLRGGAGYALGPGELFAEVRYHYVGLAFQTTGDSNAGGFTGALGYRFHM